MELKEIKPLGEFLLKTKLGIQISGGQYYHYTEVLKVLKLYKKELMDELIKKFPDCYDSHAHHLVIARIKEVIDE